MPDNDIHGVFREWACARIADPRERALFDRMAGRSGIAHRWSVLPPGSPVADGGFYAGAPPPGTAARMALYRREAPALAERAVRALGDTGPVTHLVVASCTGFTAPGIDQLLARRLGLAGQVERTLIGFMGCYAAVAALRTARHIVRSEPGARVLAVTVELSTLHLQQADTAEPLLAMLLFGDGAAAALVTADPAGIALEEPFSATLDSSEELITWEIGDTGFAMALSGAVPGRIADALAGPLGGRLKGPALAVHAGGRSILDAVEKAIGLDAHALDDSRAVLRDHGNMSSATLMFVLARILERGGADGTAIAFGPGLAAEGFHFRRAP